MRKIILCVATSYDGFIEGPNGEIDWISFTEESGKALNRFLEEIDTVFYGRISYEAWGHYQPPAESSDFEKNFYDKLNKMKKYVFSSSIKEFPGNPAIMNEVEKTSIQRIKEQEGKHIWFYGGSSLLTSFMNLDLVDEFRIALIPVILGKGKPLFRNLDHRVKLKLLEVKAGKTGIVEYRYERSDENNN